MFKNNLANYVVEGILALKFLGGYLAVHISKLDSLYLLKRQDIKGLLVLQRGFIRLNYNFVIIAIFMTLECYIQTSTKYRSGTIDKEKSRCKRNNMEIQVESKINKGTSKKKSFLSIPKITNHKGDSPNSAFSSPAVGADVTS